MFDIRQPAVIRISAIEDRARANLGQDRRIQRVRGHGHKDFVPGFGQRGERQLYALGCPGGNDDTIRRDRHLAPLALGSNGLPGGGNADRWRVAIVAVAHRALDRFD